MRLLWAILVVLGSAVMSFGVTVGTAAGVAAGVGVALQSAFGGPNVTPDIMALVLDHILSTPYFWIGAVLMAIGLYGLAGVKRIRSETFTYVETGNRNNEPEGLGLEKPSE